MAAGKGSERVGGWVSHTYGHRRLYMSDTWVAPVLILAGKERLIAQSRHRSTNAVQDILICCAISKTYACTEVSERCDST